MAKSWADLNKQERNNTGMTKKEYNRSTGYRDKVLNKGNIGTTQAVPESGGGSPIAPSPRPYPAPRPETRAIGENGGGYPGPKTPRRSGNNIKREKAQKFKDDYTGKVKKAVRKRKNRNRKRQRR